MIVRHKNLKLPNIFLKNLFDGFFVMRIFSVTIAN